MTKCVFCGKDDSPYKGVHLIANDGSINFYCSSKCRRNALNLRRDKKKMKWTSFYAEVKEKIANNLKNQKAKEENSQKPEEKPAKKEKKK